MEHIGLTYNRVNNILEHIEKYKKSKMDEELSKNKEPKTSKTKNTT
tara:strand:- start:994 stop:1131 length:138 start_codon:yes stop_codon:yes gene_type:complete